MRLIRDGDSTPPYRSTTYVRNGREAQLEAHIVERINARLRDVVAISLVTTPKTGKRPYRKGPAWHKYRQRQTGKPKRARK